MKGTKLKQTNEETAAPTSLIRPKNGNINIEEMKLIASTSALELYFNENNADFAVKEKKNGYI